MYTLQDVIFFGHLEKWLVPPQRSKKRNAKYSKVYNNRNIITFDIETTSTIHEGKKTAFCYIWQMCINGNCFYGRYLSELKYVLDIINDEKATNIIWVHNLSYEFQFLRNYISFTKVFARNERKPIFAWYKNTEFRCSYFLSNMSLDKVQKNYNIPVEKLKDEYNYSLIRTPDTSLTPLELQYCENDALILYYYIKQVLHRANGKYKNVPYTSTGYVRQAYRDYLIRTKKQYDMHQLAEQLAPTTDVFLMLEKAYCGGYVHANYYSVLQGIKTNISSYDRTSSYPAVMCCKKYPMTPFKQILRNKKTYLYNSKYAWVANIRFYNITTKGAMCLLSKHKILKSENAVHNNGRLFSADMIELYITDVDLKNIHDMYTFDKMEIGKMYISEYDYLPKPFIDFVLLQYKAKTELKGIADKVDLYNNAKAYINSLYGMCVMNPLQDTVLFEENEWSTEENEPYAIQKYYKNKKVYIVYQWGVWITAHARRELVKIVSKFQNEIDYSDTDSVKGSCITSEYIALVNESIHEENAKAAEHFGIPIEYYAPQDINGNTHELGFWDYEGTYEYFVTLGAKRYVYIQDGKIHATVAGCPKKSMETYLKTKGIEEFKDGLTISGKYDKMGKNASGKTTMLYIDDELHKITITDYLDTQREVETGYCVHASGADFSISMSPEYVGFLTGFTISSKRTRIRKGVLI